MHNSDVTIIGGGIVGLATAYAVMEQYPDLSVTVLEKEAKPALHQTGRNSGVIHSGIYYKPGSLKAENCREGRLAMIDFCERENIPFELLGKLIVAVDEAERQRLHAIHERGQANGIPCERVGPERIREMEPHAAGIEAVHVPGAGVVDYGRVAARLAEIIVERGQRVQTDAAVRGVRRFSDRLVVETTAGEVETRFLVNCAGLYSDRIARMCGHEPGVRIVPFRGEYFELTSEAAPLCRTLLYPVPDPAFPFLGVHFTRRISGRVDCGPSAVLAFAREGYRFSRVAPGELAETLAYSGFHRLALRHWRMGMTEMRQSLSKAAYVRAAQRLLPEIRAEHLVPAPAGVRAQAVTPRGDLVDDFLIVEDERAVHVCNAPSPAATASLRIGATIAERLAARF
jgi:(S)-2-hydroxyglutarate dehydrogenase